MMLGKGREGREDGVRERERKGMGRRGVKERKQGGGMSGRRLCL